MLKASPWLVILALCGANAALAQTRVQVVSPKSERLISGMRILIYTTDGRLLGRSKSTTGFFGEPVDVEEGGALDPRWKELVLQVENNGAIGASRITPDPDVYFWKQVYDPSIQAWRPAPTVGLWRPEYVYRHNSETNKPSAETYAAFRAALAPKERQRVESLEERYVSDLRLLLKNAVDPKRPALDPSDDPAKLSPQAAKLEAAFTELVAAGVKHPIDPKRVSACQVALNDVMQARLPRLDPRLRSLIVILPPPDLRERVAAIESSPLEAPVLTRIQSGMAELVNVGLAASAELAKKPNAPPSMPEMMSRYEAALKAPLDAINPLVERGQGAPADPELKARLRVALKLPIPPGLHAQVSRVVQAPSNPELLPAMESTGFQPKTWKEGIDLAMSGMVDAGLREAGKNPEWQKRVETALKEMTDPLESVFAAGHSTPLDTAARLHLQAALAGTATPEVKARMAALADYPTNPTAELLLNLTSLVEQVVREERFGAPEPPTIYIRMDREYAIPSSRY